MGKYFYTALYNSCYYLSLLGLKLIHIGKSLPVTNLVNLFSSMARKWRNREGLEGWNFEVFFFFIKTSMPLDIYVALSVRPKQCNTVNGINPLINALTLERHKLVWFAS